MRTLDDDLAVPLTDAGPHALADAGHRGRLSHVFLFNGRREVLLRRDERAGRGARWTNALVAAVHEGESYDLAARRAARDALGARLPALRYVEKTWHDEGAERTFLAVFVAMHEGPATGAHAWVPIEAVTRAVRAQDPTFDAGLARAWRVVTGEGA